MGSERLLEKQLIGVYSPKLKMHLKIVMQLKIILKMLYSFT